MIIVWMFLAFLMGIWSRPNIKESQDKSKVILSLIIFAPISILLCSFAHQELTPMCLVPLILGYLVAHPFESWLAKEIKKENNT